MTRLLLVVIAAASLLGCGGGGPEPHKGWVLHSRVQFFSPDLRVAQDPLPPDRFRLSFPFIAGDLYGPASTGDFLHPTLNSDYSFDIDLGKVQSDLLRSLQPTEFSLQYLRIDPLDARIARLAPLALQPDGIEQVATTDWINARTLERLMLVYVDRPARITGALVRDDYTIRYNVRVPAAGYIWIARRQNEDGEQMYTEVEKPESVILALTPAAAAAAAPTPAPAAAPAVAPKPGKSTSHATKATDEPAKK